MIEEISERTARAKLAAKIATLRPKSLLKLFGSSDRAFTLMELTDRVIYSLTLDAQIPLTQAVDLTVNAAIIDMNQPSDRSITNL